MTPELAYFLKINVGIALFYAFYRLFLYKDTFFHWRRTALLCFFGVSLLYPMLNLQEWVKAHEPMVAMADLYATTLLPEIVFDEVTITAGINWQDITLTSLKAIYLCGVILFSIRFIVQLISIIRLRIRCKAMQIQGVRIYALNKASGPFSFFHWIFIHPESHTEEELTEVLVHELTHARQAHDRMSRTDWLLLTWGTTFVYQQRETGRIVSNCHKQPEKLFTRRMLTVDEIVDEYTRFLKELRNQNSTLKVLFTVSPIRHIRDGMHANQLSKATLLLAIEQLQSIFPTTIFYFPSYEIMLDELRDYRFYADDMLHPSPLAVNYLWERFSDVFFSDETKKIMDECESIRKALAHRPFHPDSEQHKRFLGQIVLKIERLNGKYPYLDFEKETTMCRLALQ